jgi:hypothetical protein
VQVFTEFAQLDGLGINLSDVGMCLFIMANLQVGSQIQVEFLPLRSTDLVRVSGIVRHRALYLYGVDFLVDSDQHSGNWEIHPERALASASIRVLTSLASL